LAAKSLDGLPAAAEQLLRARTNAVAAEVARRLGNHGDSLQRLNQVLHDFPAVLRLLKIAIPVQVGGDSSPQSRQVAAALLLSPRFYAHPQGFPLSVKRQGQSLAVELLRLDGARQLAVDVKPQPNDEALVAITLEVVGAKLLSPWFDLTPVEINRLDSSPAASIVSQRIDGLFEPIKPAAKSDKPW
jgi:hypothetical protein